MSRMNEINAAATQLTKKCGEASIAIVLGSGLGDFSKELSDRSELAYADIPGFPKATVPGHEGKFISGNLMDKRVLLMSGRFHSYEGHSMKSVTLPIRVMYKAGIKTVILTNAAGGINMDFSAGTLMLITDYINLSGKNPLRGKNMDEFGPRFPDMTNAFDKKLRNVALYCAQAERINLMQGVYCWMNGPCYETPAEIRMCRTLGADAVGMSTVPETIVARHCGMKVLGISCITNMAAGINDAPISHEEVVETGMRVRDSFSTLLKSIVEQL